MLCSINKAHSTTLQPPAARRIGPRSGRCRAGRAHARPAGRDGDGACRGHACSLPRRHQGRRHRRGQGFGTLPRPRRPLRPPCFGAQAPPRPRPAGDGGQGRRPRPRPGRGKGRHGARWLVPSTVPLPPAATWTGPRGAERLSTEMWERLIEDDEIDAAGLAGQPIEEIIIRLCRDIGIDPKLVLEDEPGRGRPRKEQDEPPPAWVRPFVHPEESRYCLLPGRQGRRMGRRALLGGTSRKTSGASARPGRPTTTDRRRSRPHHEARWFCLSRLRERSEAGPNRVDRRQNGPARSLTGFLIGKEGALPMPSGRPVQWTKRSGS